MRNFPYSLGGTARRYTKRRSVLCCTNPFGPHGAEEETEELWTDLSEVPETAYEQDPKRRINSDTDMPFDPSLLPTDPGLGEGPL